MNTTSPRRSTTSTPRPAPRAHMHHHHGRHDVPLSPAGRGRVDKITVRTHRGAERIGRPAGYKNASENGGSFYFRTPDASVTKAVVRLSASPGCVSPKGIFRSLTCSTP